MGLGHSSIPNPKPGQLLMFVGQKDYDDYYASLETSIKTIERKRSKLDLKTTYLIEALGAEALWEYNPNIEIIFEMILTVLSAAGKGNMHSIATLTEDFPYIVIISKKVNRKIIGLVDKFVDFMEVVNGVTEKLECCKVFKEEIDNAEKIQKNISKRVIDKNYSMKDTLEALRIVNENKKLISSMPEEIEEMMRIAYRVPETMKKIVYESKMFPFVEILQQRGVQAAAESMTKPKEIVQKFWPVM